MIRFKQFYETDLEEAIKLGSKVKIHDPGNSHHGEVGHVGEIRHGLFKGAPKKYTVDYGDRKSIQLDKKNIKMHKESVEESKDFSKYIMKPTKTEPKIVRKTNPAGRTTDHVEYEVHGTLSSHKRTFKSKKEAEEYFNSVKESIEEAFKVGDFVKDPDGKIHRVFGVNGTNLETGLHYGKNKYGGTNNLHASKAKKIPKPKDVNEEIIEIIDEGAETWEAGYNRRVVKTSKPEHKEKGYNWRIKGKERPEISIKLYKEKPSQAEFNKQMKRVAGHEFGG